MKTKLLFIVILFFSLHINAVNVTIVESLSGNFWAVQDTMWRNVSIAMGYNTTVVPQSTLDNISNLSTTDVLVISSGSISFAANNHLQTIRQYVLSGGDVYIQSEYQPYYQGNKTFDSIMQAVGANFSWGTSVGGSLTPMNVLGTLATTPNTVSPLNYFNFGYTGSGTGVEKFLEFNGNYFGFCYSDSTSTNGTVITISDEDWAWNNISPALMENILFRLAHTTITSINTTKLSSAEVNVFPNPFADDTNLQTNFFLNNASLLVFNSLGQQVKKINNISGNTVILSRNNLPNGVYFLQLSEANKILSERKLIVSEK